MNSLRFHFSFDFTTNLKKLFNIPFWNFNETWSLLEVFDNNLNKTIFSEDTREY